MAAHHADALLQLPGVRLVACTSRSLERAQAFAEEHGIERGRTYSDLLEDPAADALWVVTPAEVTAIVAVELASLGLPLFLEKPVGLSLEETEQTATRIRVPAMVGLNRRYYEVIREGARLLDEEGGIRSIEVHMPEDLARAAQHHPERVLRQWQFANSVHLIDLFRFFAGEVAEVITLNEADDLHRRSYSALLRFHGGASGVFHARWYAPGGWRVTVYGEDLCIVYQPIEEGLIFRRGAGVEALTPSGPDLWAKAGFVGQAAAFVALVTGGEAPPKTPTLADYTKTVGLVDLLTRSQASEAND